MGSKILKIFIPCITGILGIVTGYGIGSVRTSNRFLNKQQAIEQQRKEIEYAQADSLYLLSNVVWKKQDLKSQVYSAMFDDIQTANLDKLKQHRNLNNPYWVEIITLLNKLSPYCSEKIRIVFEKNTEQKKLNLFKLYNDLQQTRKEILKEIGGIDAEQDTIVNSRFIQLEDKDLLYLQNNNIWDNDSIWSEKYVKFMIGMLSGNTKVFLHTEINNILWQEILRYSRYRRSYYLKEIILQASNKENVNITKLHEMITEKFDEKKQEKPSRNNSPSIGTDI